MKLYFFRNGLVVKKTDVYIHWILLGLIVAIEFFADCFLYYWAKIQVHENIDISNPFFMNIYNWSKQSSFNTTLSLIIGVLIYAISIFLWAFILESEKLSVLSLIYSASGIIIALVLAFLIFHESFDWKKILALVFCILAIICSEI
jgi:multidrug transporter EmrE-like cation transporter